MFHSFQYTNLAHILLVDIFTLSVHSDGKNILVKKRQGDKRCDVIPAKEDFRYGQSGHIFTLGL